MSDDKTIQDLKDEIETLQYRMGGTEYLIKLLVQKMHPNEIADIKSIMNEAISVHKQDGAVVKVLNEGLRLLG
ncbi:hypothetical protein [Rahnella sp. Larv3_ips]|uniref:hypothetical protein n=1 Tax=Rahnella sp. Larv3_ips TaxID=1896943 RepID=UPI000EFAD159|nr:hypothetical protein [Rahnella sp. Larv3_ips]